MSTVSDFTDNYFEIRENTVLYVPSRHGDAEQRRSRPPFVRSNLSLLVLQFTMALARKFSLR